MHKVRNRVTASQAVAAWIMSSLFAAGMALAADSSARQTVPLSPPAPTAIPTGPLGQAIQYGQRIVTDTQATAKGYVGNGLRCANCHLDGGRTAYAAPLVGLTGLFPEYRSRRGSVESLEDRINDCFLRSMNGKALPGESREMIGLLAYIAWLSQGVPTGSEVEGRGFREIHAPRPADASRGKAVYLAKCAACHGADGQGVKTGPGAYAFPPLWGSQSFNVGAGMARLSVAAAFVQAKMPLGNAGTLTDQEAYDVAAYFTTQPRPDFSGKKRDWPEGGRPADAR
jgi:thiosulfate dehydrogenase